MHVSELWRTTLRPAILDAAEVTDLELLKRFREAHDAVAFEVLIHRHGPMVWAACRRIIGYHHAAEDAFQATFLALARRSGDIRGSVSAWVHRVAVRAGLDVLRRARRNELPVPDPEAVDRRPGPLESATATELAQQIDVAINRLPERLRKAFVLCELHGYSLKAAATHLACPVGTVESRLARARQRLRNALTGALPTAPVLGVVAVPHALWAQTVRMASENAPVQPAIAALAVRVAGGACWGRALSGLAVTMAAALVVATMALGQPEASKPAPKAPEPVATQEVPPIKGPLEAARMDLPQGAIVRLGSNRFRHPGTWSYAIAFSPDGSQLAVGHNLGISIFATKTGQRLQHFPTVEGQTARRIRFVADGKQLLVSTTDGQRAAGLTRIDLGTGKQVRKAKFTGKQQVFVIDVTNDGKQVLVEDRFHKVFLWDLAAARELWSIAHPEASFTMPLTADGKAFVLAMSRKAELRDAATGKVLAVFPTLVAKFRNYYHAAAMAQDGKLAIVSEEGDRVAILDARGKQRVQTFQADHAIHQLVFSADGRFLVGFDPVGTLVWDTTAADTGPVARLPGASNVGFAPDGKVLALGDVGSVSLWSVGAYSSLPQSADPASPVRSVRFSADGKRVHGYTQLGWMSWPLSGGPALRLSDASRVFHEGMSQVSSDGRVAVDVLHKPAAGRDRGKYALRITDFGTGKARRIELDRDVWDPLALSPDGRFVSVSLAGAAFVVWDTATGAEVLRQKQTGEGRSQLGMQLAKDGKSILRSVTGVWAAEQRSPLDASYSTVHVTDHVRKREIKLLPTPRSNYSGGVRFSDDGSKVMIAGHFDQNWRQDTVAIWDVASGRRLLSWTRPSGRLDALQFSPDGRSMVIGDATGKLAIVEIASGQERAAFYHGGMILSAAFHADGTKVVASSPEAPIYIWDLLGTPRKWDANQADALWAALASPDAKSAFAAMQTLRAHPAEGIALLRDRVKLPTVPPETKVAAWLRQLNSSKFDERDQAQRELIGVADLIPSHLEAARKGASLEVTRRLDAIRLSATETTSERLRLVRACEILEGIRTAPAAKALAAWAAGPAGAKLTTEATESVARLKLR